MTQAGSIDSTKRRFLKMAGAGLAAPLLSTGLPAMATDVWARELGVSMLSAANDEENRTFLIGLSEDGTKLFQIPIPSRGHAAAIHPRRAEAVAFARRPGTFALVVDCKDGKEVARLQSPEGRHFYGHGAFSADGSRLYTTENAYDLPEGMIGVWDANAGYERLGEFRSGGIGPHEILRLSDGTFAIANGGIQTHPDYVRSKLNLHKMRPNLAILSAEGKVLEQVEPPKKWHKNSIRHIATSSEDQIFIALQWQGSPLAQVPLAASYRRGGELVFHDHPDMLRLKNYGGSVAVNRDQSEFAITSPKGDSVLFFDCKDGTPKGGHSLIDATGAIPFGKGFAISFKDGLAMGTSEAIRLLPSDLDLVWDNHLVAIS